MVAAGVRLRRFAAAGIVLLVALACGRPTDGGAPLSVWVMGREGELVRELLPEFERRNPGVRVRVQQIPWSAAHEKLLTAYVGESLPDVVQLGNTWIPELVALGRSITERAVPALVAQPGQLRMSLLGMTFLNRLERWEVRGDRLSMRGYP